MFKHSLQKASARIVGWIHVRQVCWTPKVKNWSKIPQHKYSGYSSSSSKARGFWRRTKRLRRNWGIWTGISLSALAAWEIMSPF